MTRRRSRRASAQVLFLPLFRELCALLPATTIVIEMIGPLGVALPPPARVNGASGGSLTISVRSALYHTLHLPRPDVVVAPNAGFAVAGYADRWPETLRYLHERTIPFVFTDYSEQSVEKGLELAAKQKDAAVASAAAASEPRLVYLNPFRMPLREPLVCGGAAGFPTVSNGFLASFHTPPGAFDDESIPHRFHSEIAREPLPSEPDDLGHARATLVTGADDATVRS